MRGGKELPWLQPLLLPSFLQGQTGKIRWWGQRPHTKPGEGNKSKKSLGVQPLWVPLGNERHR